MSTFYRKSHGTGKYRLPGMPVYKKGGDKYPGPEFSQRQAIHFIHEIGMNGFCPCEQECLQKSAPDNDKKTMINKVILVGRLGSDPEIRPTSTGTQVVRFNIATSERVPALSGNGWEERVEWHRIVTFGKLAETCSNYLTKGRLVYIEGRLRTNSWEDKNGNTHHTTEVVAEMVRFLSPQRSEENVDAGMESEVEKRLRRSSSGASMSSQSSSASPDDEDDVPF